MACRGSYRVALITGAVSGPALLLPLAYVKGLERPFCQNVYVEIDHERGAVNSCNTLRVSQEIKCIFLVLCSCQPQKALELLRDERAPNRQTLVRVRGTSHAGAGLAQHVRRECKPRLGVTNGYGYYLQHFRRPPGKCEASHRVSLKTHQVKMRCFLR